MVFFVVGYTSVIFESKYVPTLAITGPGIILIVIFVAWPAWASMERFLILVKANPEVLTRWMDALRALWKNKDRNRSHKGANVILGQSASEASLSGASGSRNVKVTPHNSGRQSTVSSVATNSNVDPLGGTERHGQVSSSVSAV